jgi:hypothetical protein
MQMIDLVVSPSRSDRDACGNLFADTPAGRSRPSGRTGPRGLLCRNGGKPRRAGQLASRRSVLIKGSGAYPGLSVGSVSGPPRVMPFVACLPGPRRGRPAA